MEQINNHTKKFTLLNKFLYQDKKIINELKTELGYLDEDKFEFNSLDKLIQEIRDNYSSETEDRENDMYINYTYQIDTENYIFEISGSSYIKNSRIYEEILDDHIYVIDKNLKKIDDEIEKNKKLAKNEANWLEFFENKTFEEVRAELLKYKFPIKNN
jgi:hypothetical protein